MRDQHDWQSDLRYYLGDVTLHSGKLWIAQNDIAPGQEPGVVGEELWKPYAITEAALDADASDTPPGTPAFGDSPVQGESLKYMRQDALPGLPALPVATLRNILVQSGDHNAQQDDLDIGDADMVVFQTNSPDTNNYVITGIAGGTDGRVVVLVNASDDDTIILGDPGNASTAANRFEVAGLPGGILVIYPGRSAAIVYDATVSLWRVVTGNLVDKAGNWIAAGTGLSQFSFDQGVKFLCGANYIYLLAGGAIELANEDSGASVIINADGSIAVHNDAGGGFTISTDGLTTIAADTGGNSLTMDQAGNLAILAPTTSTLNSNPIATGFGVPAGGTTGQIPAKASNTDGDIGWEDLFGVPAGGTTGQKLVKASNTDGDTEWGDDTDPTVTTLAGSPGDVTGSRALNTDYVNALSVPIMVHASVALTANATAGFKTSLDGDAINNSDEVGGITGRFQLSFLVDAGATYGVPTANGIGTSTLHRWTETAIGIA